jgi:hypothetical protein
LIACRQRRQAADGAGGFFGIERMSKLWSLRTGARGFAVVLGLLMPPP